MAYPYQEKSWFLSVYTFSGSVLSVNLGSIAFVRTQVNPQTVTGQALKWQIFTHTRWQHFATENLIKLRVVLSFGTLVSQTLSDCYSMYVTAKEKERNMPMLGTLPEGQLALWICRYMSSTGHMCRKIKTTKFNQMVMRMMTWTVYLLERLDFIFLSFVYLCNSIN